jgi:glutathione S-transferase
MDQPLTLYTHPMSRGRIARWMLEEVGQPYEVIILDLGAPPPDYRRINPMGKVPALVHGTRTVTECAAICTYLADAFPGAGLIPQGDRASFYRWMFFGAGPLEAAVTNRALNVDIPPDRRRMVGYGTFDLMAETLESAVATGPFICGDQFTAADVYLGAQIGFGLQFGSLPAREGFVAYWDRIKNRPARLRAAAMDDALIRKG